MKTYPKNYNLLEAVNQHLAKANFKKAHYELVRYIQQGAFGSRTNRRLKKELKKYYSDNKQAFKKPSASNVDALTYFLQSRALGLEQDLDRSPINFSNVKKLIWLVLGILLGAIIHPLFNEWNAIPRFNTSDAKQRIFFYDFINNTSVETNIADLFNKSINSELNEWHKHLSSKRFEGLQDHKRKHLLSDLNHYTNFFKKLNFPNRRADYAIGGIISEGRDSFLLNLSTYRYDFTTAALDSSSQKISIPKESIGDFIYNPCTQSFILDLIKIDPVNKVQEWIALNTKFRDCHNMKPLQRLNTKTLQKIEVNKQQKSFDMPTIKRINDFLPPENQLDFPNAINTIPDCLLQSSEEASSDDASTQGALSEIESIYQQMKQVPIPNENIIRIELVPSKDTINLICFYCLNRASLDPSSKLVVESLSQYTQQLAYRGSGHTCHTGEPHFDNNQLSTRRIKNLIRLTGRDPNQGKGYHAYGSDHPYRDSRSDALNRRCRIQFFKAQTSTALQTTPSQAVSTSNEASYTVLD